MAPMSERLNGIEAFVAAVETGNFALAAQRLGLTRSAVGKSVARLEARLGTRLFHRTARSQSLTEDGQAYYERCRRALAELEAADAALEAGRLTPAGRLRISMPELLGRLLVAPLLLELGAQYPALSFDASFNDRRVDLVEEGVDLAIRSGPLDDSTALAARPMGHQWMGMFASPAYLDAHGRPASLEALLAQAPAHRFVGYVRDSGRHPWQFRDAKGQVVAFTPPSQFDFGCNSLEIAALAAAQGAGIARLPVWLVREALDQGRLVRVFEEPQAFGYAVHAVWPHARAMPLKTRVLIDLLVERLVPALTLR